MKQNKNYLTNGTGLFIMKTSYNEKRRWEQVPMCGTNRKQPVDERHTESTDGFMEQP
ncbi:MAG: hypothetical protein ACLTZS_05220 [Roseburia faecis]